MTRQKSLPANVFFPRKNRPMLACCVQTKRMTHMTGPLVPRSLPAHCVYMNKENQIGMIEMLPFDPRKTGTFHTPCCKKFPMLLLVLQKVYQVVYDVSLEALKYACSSHTSRSSHPSLCHAFWLQLATGRLDELVSDRKCRSPHFPWKRRTAIVAGFLW